MGNMGTSTSMGTVEGALRLWTEIVNGLRSAGYSRVVPEYLKLSQMLSQAKLTELVTGQPEAPHWNTLRSLAGEALLSLGPLAEAARILAELPLEIQPTGTATLVAETSLVQTETVVEETTVEVSETLVLTEAPAQAEVVAPKKKTARPKKASRATKKRVKESSSRPRS